LQSGRDFQRQYRRSAIGSSGYSPLDPMSIANPLWGAPRIHGELLKLGFDV
jgi:hypothetical protein